jgi:zinc protease
VDRYWGEWKRGSYQPEIPQEPPQDAARSARVSWTGATLPMVTVAFKVPAYTDETRETAALDALAAVAFASNSDLYQKLVIRDQTVDSLFASSPSKMDSGLFQITARVRKLSDLDAVRDEILATVRSLQEKPVDAARLDAVRKRLRYSVALQMQSNDAIAGVLAAYVALRRTPETINRLYEQFAQLTPEDVQQAAAKYLVERGRTIVTLTAAGGGQ